MCDYHYTKFKCSHIIQNSLTPCAALIPGVWIFAAPACKEGTHTEECDKLCPVCEREETENKRKDPNVYYSFPEFKTNKRW